MENDIVIFEKLSQILKDNFYIKNEITADSKFSDLGLEKYDVIEFSMRVEDDFNVWIDDEEIENFHVVKDLIECVKNKPVRETRKE